MDAVFDRCIELGADQVTFRRLHQSGTDSKEDRWIREHPIDQQLFEGIFSYVKEKGTARDHLPL